ncbi:MAG: putative DNA modification/repair radical SAM protein [Clostridiales bacterium]|nr:putative DNA modification/repair radical SAM protein [Clostridiales bacterium]
MDVMDKLKILTGAAKYDVACTSSGVERAGQKGRLGSAVAAGICHSFAADGRCVSLLKVLMTNYCIYDCKYCVNRASSDVPRAAFTPEEVAELTMNFYKRNYIEGLFLSSAIIQSPNYTMELLYKTLVLVREQHRFNGYIHVKAIPGADAALIQKTGALADRMSVNIELPSADSLKKLAPDKSKQDILAPMRLVKNNIEQAKNELQLYRHAGNFVPAGQATQMIIGATPETDRKIVGLAENLYQRFSLKRVFYSAYTPVGAKQFLPDIINPPMLREHRLYQADWLLRFYGFKADDLFNDQNEQLNLNMDPKCQWAINHISLFPVEINRADYMTLLRIPGVGVRSAQKIMSARRVGALSFENLKKMGIVLKRAKYFITCGGKMMTGIPILYPEVLTMRLTENKINESCDQLSLWDAMKTAPRLTDARQTAGAPALSAAAQPLLLPTREDVVKCVTGEL